MQRKQFRNVLSQMVVENGDESHGIESAKNHLKQTKVYLPTFAVNLWYTIGKIFVL